MYTSVASGSYIIVQISVTGYRGQFGRNECARGVRFTAEPLLGSVDPGSLSAQRSLKSTLNVSASVSACTMCSAHSFDLLMCFLRRCAARGLRGTQALVLYCLLRAQQSCRGGVPGFLYQCARRRLHRSLQQLQPILSRLALQRQPQLNH